jgi:predicted MPP superfamily phosphohydrolase
VLRRTLITVVIGTILVLLFGLPWWVIVASDGWPAPAVVVGTVVLALALVAFPALMASGHVRGSSDTAARAGDTLLGVIWLLFAWSVLGEVAWLVLSLAGVPDPTGSRIVAIAVVAVVLVLATTGYRAALRVPRVVTTDVPIPGLGADLDGLRVVVLADTHFGPIDRTRWSELVARLVNDLNPDIVCHAGDLADGTVAQRGHQVAPLGTMRAGLAKLYITGNHEYFSGAQDWLDHMTSLGWEPLHNRHHVVRRGAAEVIFAGIDDPTGRSSGLAGHGPDIDAALAGADPDVPVVLLAHQPKQITVAEAAGVALQISGHTHGGQIWPFHLIVRADQPSLAGLTRHGARTRLYTSRGAGFWGPPFRVFAPSEVSLLVLRKEG